MSEASVAGAQAKGLGNNRLVNDKPKEFVRRLMVAKCSEGKEDFYQYLNLPKDHGVYFYDTEQPLMNACDYKSGEHVLHFGRCKSELNPKNMISKGIDDIVSNPLVKMLCPAAALVDTVGDIRDKLGGTGCKCSPKTIKVWEETNEGNCLDGADGILNTSHLTCCYGGQIVITEMPDNGGNNQQDTEDKPGKKTVMERMPKAVAESINDMNSEQNSATGEGEASQEAGSAAQGTGGASQGTSGATPGAHSKAASHIQDWYANEDDFEQNYGVTGETILSNYANNRCQEVPQGALNEEGYITDMSELSSFRMGGSSAALIGAGCVSAYNAMHAMGVTQPLPDVIMATEVQQTVPGYMDQGPMTVSMMSTAAMFKSMGFQTNTIPADGLMSAGAKGRLEKGGVAIIGRSGKDGRAEFHTLKADGEGRLQCMENRALSVEKLLAEENSLQMILGISRQK